MKTKTLLVLSIVLNAGLLGAVTYLFKLIPEGDCMPAAAAFVGGSSFNGSAHSTSQTAPSLQFEEVIEALLPSPRNGQRPELFDLETGRRMTEPAFEYFGNHAQASIAWIRTNGLDISGFVFDGEHVTCICYYMAVVPVAPQRWEQATSADIFADPELGRIHDPKRMAIMPERDTTNTFLFRTAAGTTGILQILGASADLRTVKIRYKLFKPAQTGEA